TKEIKFETKAKTIEASEVSVTPSSMKLYVDATNILTVTLKPDNATSEVKYISSDNSVVTVSDKGIVKGVAPGVATITVKAGEKSANCSVCVEDETVVFEMQNNVSVKAESHEKIPFKATHISCYDFVINKTDVTDYVEFHTAYTSALINDGAGNIEAAGAVFETVDIPVYFTYSDGSSFFVQSPTFNIHVEK
ncbi:MAG: Ig-like domain-containing protein, partial [Bacilli bacterium]|nr:Ig-like domain-containing protein [Bacilli bacterium]